MKKREAFTTDVWTMLNAIQVTTEATKQLTINKLSRELAAAVVLRCNALVGELTNQFNLPVTDQTSEQVLKMIELAEKAGWA